MITTQMVIDAAWEVYADQYKNGATMSDIARRAGITRMRVTDKFKQMGVYDPSKAHAGAPKRDRCKRGHDLAVHGKPIKNKRGGRYCAECHRLRAAGAL